MVLAAVATTVGGAGLESECSSEPPPVKSSCRAGFFAGKPDSSTPSFFGGNSPPPPPPSPILKKFRISSFSRNPENFSFFSPEKKKSHLRKNEEFHKSAQENTHKTKPRSESRRNAKNQKPIRRLLKSSNGTLNLIRLYI